MSTAEAWFEIRSIAAGGPLSVRGAGLAGWTFRQFSNRLVEFRAAVEERMIPEEKRSAIARGLVEAFGTEEIDDIRAVTGGHTGALVYRVVVRGSAYLLRMIMRTDT